MSKIGVDIDDSLYSFGSLARNVLADEAARTGDKLLERAAYAEWPEWRSPVDLLGTEEWLRIIALCHDEEMIRVQQPFEGAVELLTELAEEHELVYVSTRDTERYMATKEWLTNNLFPDGELVCSGQDKNIYLKSCQYLIDDRPKNLIQFVYDPYWVQAATDAANSSEEYEATKRVGFGLLHSYNRSLTDVPNIYLAPNWTLLRTFMEKTRLLKEKVYA